MISPFKNPGPIVFKAIIKSNRDHAHASSWIEFPYDLADQYGVNNLIPVIVNLDDKVTYKVSLVKMSGLNPIILVHKDVREMLSKRPGDEVMVRIELDNKHGDVEAEDD
jgi:hypothetical protein